jgi:hypothetical protein
MGVAFTGLATIVVDFVSDSMSCLEHSLRRGRSKFHLLPVDKAIPQLHGEWSADVINCRF